MKYKKLGTTDLDVSLICLGTMTWGTQNSEKDAFEQMDYSVNKGINFFDTAEIYSVPPTAESYGKTEEMIGNWFEKRKNREKIILASKVAGPGCDWIRGGKNSFDEKKIGEAIDGSLKRLKTDYIDLYQLHWPERSTNYFGKREYSVNENEGNWNSFESILQALEKFIKSGKIRHIGMSNETPFGLSKYIELSKSKNLPRMMSVQNPYNLVNRTYEIGMSEISLREKCGLLVYYPLAAGGLSGEPLFVTSTSILAEVAGLSQNRLGLIGVGGVSAGWQAYAKILVGADLVQLYTGLALEGPYLPNRILHELTHMLDTDGVTRLDQIKGQIADPSSAIKHAVGLYEGL